MIVGQSIPASLETGGVNAVPEGINAVIVDSGDIDRVQIWIQREDSDEDISLFIDRAALDVALKNYDRQVNE